MVREDDKWGVRHPDDKRARNGALYGIQLLARAEARTKNKQQLRKTFRYMMIYDNATVLGWTGTLATVSIGQWNEVIACVCGVVTTVYMATKLVQTLRNKNKDK